MKNRYSLTKDAIERLTESFINAKKIITISDERNWQNPFNVLTEVEAGNIYVPESSNVSIKADYKGQSGTGLETGIVIPTYMNSSMLCFCLITTSSLSVRLYQYSWYGESLYEYFKTLADSTSVLSKYNSNPFTPSGDYNPATKKYVDDKDLYSEKTSSSVNNSMWNKASPMYIFKQGVVIYDKAGYEIFNTDDEFMLVTRYRIPGYGIVGYLITHRLNDSVSGQNYGTGIYNFNLDSSSVYISNKLVSENDVLLKENTYTREQVDSLLSGYVQNNRKIAGYSLVTDIDEDMLAGAVARQFAKGGSWYSVLIPFLQKYCGSKTQQDANTNAIAVLNGTSEGSVSKTVSDALAQIIADAPEDLNTLKEISDWISSHADDASAMNSKILENTEKLNKMKQFIGELPEGADVTTVMDYIDSAIQKAFDGIASAEGREW